MAPEPTHPDDLLARGNAFHGQGRFAEAAECYRQAIALAPGLAGAHSNLGNALQALGRPEEALVCCRRALALDPALPQGHFNLGHVLYALGQRETAALAFQRALTCRPDYPEAFNALCNVLRDLGRLQEAIACGRRAIALRPDLAEAHNHLGNAYHDLGRLPEALGHYQRAVELQPDFAVAQSNLGNALRDAGHLEQAVLCCRRAIALRPEYAPAHNHLGNALRDQGHLEEATAAFRRAVELQPDYAQAHSNLGTVLYDHLQMDAAVAAYRRAIELRPDFAEAHKNLALALLLQGRFAEGWAEHEWRWKYKGFPSPPRNFAPPLWDGAPLKGRTILLHAEQGRGDTIQFLRYVPLVLARGGKVLLECQPELHRLVQRTWPDLPVLAFGDPLPAFDVHCPLLSLPRAFGTTLETIPAAVPYLIASAAEELPSGNWKLETRNSLTVGLVWAGNRVHPNDAQRSIPAATLLSALAGVPKVRFVSLQKGPEAAPASLLAPTPELGDFADTAGLIAQLDLVITVDTAVAHLAGALGKPVWVLLPFAPDWRWLLDRTESPWYPTMRLFRQSARGDWASVLARVQAELTGLARRTVS